MQTLETIAKIMSYLMTLTAIPTVAITIGRYYYDKRKSGIEERIKLGYLPLYEHFYYEYNITEFQKKIHIVAYTGRETLYDLIKNNKVDKSVLPLELFTLITQYEVWMDIASTGIAYLNTGKNSCDDEELIERVEEVFEEISSEIAISTDEEIDDEDILDENFPEEYIYMVESALKMAKEIEIKIKEFVKNKIKTEYKYR